MNKKFFATMAIMFLFIGCSPAEDTIVEEIEEIEDIEEISAVVEDLAEVGSIEEVVEDIYQPEENNGKVVGSCNSIEAHSACIDYTGSFWTWQIIDLGCTEEGMFASKNPCPVESIGGCRIGGGTASEMTTWFYGFGGEPIDPENEQYAMGACNATLGSSWTEQN